MVLTTLFLEGLNLLEVVFRVPQQEYRPSLASIGLQWKRQVFNLILRLFSHNLSLKLVLDVVLALPRVFSPFEDLTQPQRFFDPSDALTRFQASNFSPTLPQRLFPCEILTQLFFLDGIPTKLNSTSDRFEYFKYQQCDVDHLIRQAIGTTFISNVVKQASDEITIDCLTTNQFVGIIAVFRLDLLVLASR